MYIFKNNRRVKGFEPEIIGNELTRILDDNGSLTPEIVLGESQNKKSLFHGYFTWDDSIAAHEHRLHQARNLISSIQVIEDENSQPVQAFINITVSDSGGEVERVYLPANEVSSNTQLREQHLNHLKTRLKNMRIEYSAFSELAKVWSAVDAECK